MPTADPHVAVRIDVDTIGGNAARLRRIWISMKIISRNGAVTDEKPVVGRRINAALPVRIKTGPARNRGCPGNWNGLEPLAFAPCNAFLSADQQRAVRSFMERFDRSIRQALR